MRKWTAWLLLIALLFASACAENTIDLAAKPTQEAPAETRVYLSESALLTTPPIDLNCGAALLAEVESGQILFQMNADQPRPVASVTKIMTILLTLEAIEKGRIAPDQQTTISQSASGMGGSQVLLDTGEVQTVDVLLKSTIVGSANDACVALAELMYGSEKLCVEQMNRRAKQLGMESTHFVNCTGLPAEGQHTTARDVAIMTLAMLRHDLYYQYSNVWLDDVSHGDGRITQLTNTNKLIRQYDGCDGGKTGSTKEAGYCISATAKRGDMRVIAVVLGADSGKERFKIASGMMDYAFANYRLYPVARRGTKVRGRMPVDGGRPDQIDLMLSDDLTLLIAKGSEQNVQLNPDLPDHLTAPIAAGESVGSVQVVLDGREAGRVGVAAAQASEANGLHGNLLRIICGWSLK